MVMNLNCLLVQVFLVLLLQYSAVSESTVTYNVQSYGAKPDGKTDSTKAFLSAWGAACGSIGWSTIYVPSGKYLLRDAQFSGQYCKNKGVTFQIDGTLVAPADIWAIGNIGNWLSFNNVNNVNIQGGILDGQGTALWNCKNAGKRCPGGATTLRFSNSNNIMIKGLTSVNSQLYHIVINGCYNVKVLGVNIQASGDSPNTDGIHVQMSTDVTIWNSKISTGDDCVSIGPGTTSLWIEKVSCGPGHGISIGSLGKDLQEFGVRNVTVKTVTFTGTQNGARIKSWGRPSSGYVWNVLFQHITMVNVNNPIVIDQNYCPHNEGCPGQSSGVKISDIHYDDIHGSSATKLAVQFNCRKTNPCSGITLNNINLTYGSNQPAAASCDSAQGTAYGVELPASCL